MRPLVVSLLLVAACARPNAPAEAPVNDPPLTSRVPLRCEAPETEVFDEGAAGAHRVKGDPAVPLSDLTLVRLHDRGIHKVGVIVRFCLDPKGALTCLDLGEDPQPREIAQTIVSHMEDWAWDPYLVHGQAQAVCSRMIFNYKIQ